MKRTILLFALSLVLLFGVATTASAIFASSGSNNQVPGVFATISSVPEPSIMILMGVGLLGLAGLGRRKQLNE